MEGAEGGTKKGGDEGAEAWRAGLDGRGDVVDKSADMGRRI